MTKSNNLNQQNCEEKVSKSVTINNIQLKNRCLTMDRVTTKTITVMALNSEGKPCKVLYKKELKPEVENIVFDLQEISVEEISNLRQKGVPSFVLKEGEKYFWAKVPKRVSFRSLRDCGLHLCGSSCLHMSSAKEEDGGCQKVRDLPQYKKIERYPFILRAYETFGTRVESFVILCCANYEKCPDKRIGSNVAVTRETLEGGNYW